MKDIRAPRRPGRRFAAAALAAVVALSGVAVIGAPASAHDGVDHDTEPGADSALDWTNYEKVLLTKDVGEPIDLTVLPDKSVLHTARNGEIRLTDPSTGITRVTNTIPVYTNSEDGLQSIGVDPQFAENGWVYVVYAPLSDTPVGSAPQTLPAGADDSYWDQWMGVNRLSRFQWTGTELDLASEQTIIEIPVQRGQCCHVGADFDWDAEGNMYLATGDNTPAGTPGASGYAPNNDAPGLNPGFDARRGAGNTNDLRGKILRFTVQPDGTYTIPEGNLFAPGTESTRPEIFVMGVRNPFRIDVDAETNSLSWGDYGPDAGAADPARGPMGYVEWNTTPLDTAMNSGWPYCTGENFAYNEWDFETATPGPFFDCAAPVNNSRWNTGLTELPASTPATLYYGDQPGQQPWDEMVNFGTGSGQGPHGGPVYHFDAENPSTTKFPEYWDSKAFFGEFSQDYLAAFTVDWAASEVTHIEDFLPNTALYAAAQPIHDNPMDLEFGPDGSLYVLEYGDGFFRANPDAGLYRIDYAEGNKSPQASFTATPGSSSEAPLTVAFDASASTDPEGSALTYDWDFEGDGTFDATGVEATHTYTELGQYVVRLRVTDEQGKLSLTSRPVTVGNQAPEVTVAYPANGGFFNWGQAVPFSITTDDAEDGTETVCSRVSWTFGLGHDEHAHPEVQGTGCRGAWLTPVNAPEHGPTSKLYGAVVVRYTDAGANGLPAATGEATVHLNPFLQQAEHATERSGVTVYADESASASSAIRGLGAGDFLRYSPVSFAGITGVSVVANGGGQVQMRWGAADAEPFAVADIPAGAGWKTVEVPLPTVPDGSGDLFVTSGNDLALDALTFQGAGVADVTAPVVSHTLTPGAPTGVGGVYNVPVSLGIAAQDVGQLASVQYSLDAGATWTTIRAVNGAYTVPFPADGTYAVTYRATDTGGNVSELGSAAFTIDLDAPDEPTVDSTTVVTVPAARVVYGAPGEVTVTVAGEGGVPTGTVAVMVGETQVGTGTLAEGTATIALDPTLPVGTHVLAVAYQGDEVFKPSTTTGRITVARATSTITGVVSPNPVKPAIAPKVTVQVATSTGFVTTGDVSVTVTRNNVLVATATGTLDATGAVVVTLPKLSTVGTYKVELNYAGTASVTRSSSSTTLTVRS